MRPFPTVKIIGSFGVFDIDKNIELTAQTRGLNVLIFSNNRSKSATGLRSSGCRNVFFPVGVFITMLFSVTQNLDAARSRFVANPALGQ